MVEKVLNGLETKGNIIEGSKIVILPCCPLLQGLDVRLNGHGNLMAAIRTRETGKEVSYLNNENG